MSWLFLKFAVFAPNLLHPFFFTMFFLFLFATISSVCASYSPASGADWTLLKPDCEQPEGSLGSVDFNFGLVVSPYVISSGGHFVAPEITSIPREFTTSYVATTVVAAPKATKLADVFQIHDGQVQRVENDENENENDCNEETPAEETPGDSLKTPVSGPQNQNDEYCEELPEDLETHEEDSPDAEFWEDLEYAKREEDCEDIEPVYAVSCATESTLLMSLQDGILRDSQDRIGSIVGSHQFQFDSPVPQHGAIYAAGWLITVQGQLCLGSSTRFYQCSSGDFYNLYDEPIGDHCVPVSLDVVELIEC